MGTERMRLLKRGMKWYCSFFPFGSFCVFVKLCRIAEPKPCAAGALMCVCVCVCVNVCASKRRGKQRESVFKCKMQKCLKGE